MTIKSIILSLGLLLCVSGYLYAETQPDTLEGMPLQSVDLKVKTSFVCMMDNKFKGKEQIPVMVNGKTYYGCCQGCVHALKNNRDIRYARDPLTGEEVDKADAYITLKSNGTDSVFYFKSVETYADFMKQIYSQNK
jgi:YHS domain-containing protein